MSEPDEGVMSLVMKLLNLANDDGATPHERALAEERAEKLMAQHTIDRFEAEQKAKSTGHQVRKPIQDSWTIQMDAYYRKGDDESRDNEFGYQMINMMEYVLEHCNVRVNRNWAYAKIERPSEFNDNRPRFTTDSSRRVYQIVGYPEDIAYAERIWFNVFKTFVSNVNPHWDVEKSIEFNAYTFASAGVSWKQQVLIAEAAGDTRIEWPWRYQGDDRNQPFFSSYRKGGTIDPGNEPWGRSIHKLKRACKKYCDAQGVAYPYAGGTKLRVATRNSFARSYRSTIQTRLSKIRKMAQEGEEHVDSKKYALARIDTRASVDEEFYRVFPEFDPEVRRRKMEEEEWLRACAWASLTPKEQQRLLREEAREEEAYQRKQANARNRYRAIREDPAERYDGAAWARGKQAAESVNLRADGEVKKETRKEIH